VLEVEIKDLILFSMHSKSYLELIEKVMDRISKDMDLSLFKLTKV
jgi:hypothetical protein